MSSNGFVMVILSSSVRLVRGRYMVVRQGGKTPEPAAKDGKLHLEEAG